MKLIKNSTYYLTVFLILFACCTQETEGLRRVLRGRRTLTRKYFVGPAIPGWSIVLLIGIGELFLGAVLYLVLRKVILDTPVEHSNTYAAARTDEV